MTEVEELKEIIACYMKENAELKKNHDKDGSFVVCFVMLCMTVTICIGFYFLYEIVR